MDTKTEATKCFLRENALISETRKELDRLYRLYTHRDFSKDPQYTFSTDLPQPDLETAAFIASVFAYGKVEAMNEVLRAVYSRMDGRPFEYLIRSSAARIQKDFGDLYYRFYTVDDIQVFFTTLSLLLRKHGGLRHLFLGRGAEGESDTFPMIERVSCIFHEAFRESTGTVSHGHRFMFPLPQKGSACKRMHLFLRWMVRKDKIDFGIWHEADPARLVIPLDTHTVKASHLIGLTEKKTANRMMALEVTGGLKKINPDDPVKYDFVLCHLMMEGKVGEVERIGELYRREYIAE